MHLSETLTILVLLLPVILLLLAIIDLVRRDFSKPMDKAVWFLIVILVPFIGPLVYYFTKKRSFRHS